METRRKQNKRKPIDEKCKNKFKRQNVRDECFEQCMDNNETEIENYGLRPRVNN